MTSIRPTTDNEMGPITEGSRVSLSVVLVFAGALVAAVLKFGVLDARVSVVERTELSDAKAAEDRMHIHESSENDRLSRMEDKIDRLLELRDREARR